MTSGYLLPNSMGLQRMQIGALCSSRRGGAFGSRRRGERHVWPLVRRTEEAGRRDRRAIGSPLRYLRGMGRQDVVQMLLPRREMRWLRVHGSEGLVGMGGQHC